MSEHEQSEEIIAEEPKFRFLASTPHLIEAASDPRFQWLAAQLAEKLYAGFGDVIPERADFYYTHEASPLMAEVTGMEHSNPDAYRRILLMHYHMSDEDVDGAWAAFEVRVATTYPIRDDGTWGVRATTILTNLHHPKSFFTFGQNDALFEHMDQAFLQDLADLWAEQDAEEAAAAAEEDDDGQAYLGA